MGLQAAVPSDQLIQRLEPQGLVNDYAGVFDAAGRRRLEALLNGLEQQTGAQLAVVVLPSMEGGQIDDFAVRLFESWGIGRQGGDNGMLLLASLEERRVRIEVGYGLEGVLPDAAAGRVLDRYVLPQFRAGNVAEGLAAGADALARRIADDAGVELQAQPYGARSPPRTDDEGPSILSALLNLLILIGIVFLFIRHPFLAILLLSGGRGRGFSGGGFGGGFGGFGGGLSGGGGASRGW